MAGLGLGILLGCLKKITLFSLEVLYYFAAPFYAKSNEILEKQNMLGGKKKKKKHKWGFCSSVSKPFRDAEMPKKLKGKSVQMRILLQRSSDAPG